MKKRLAPALLALVTSLTIVVSAYAQNGVIPNFDPSCTPLVHLISQNYTTGTQYNTQGLEPEYPIWCYPQPQAGAPTRVNTGASWVDTWDNDGPSIQTLNDGDYDYKVFPRLDSRFKSGAFINSNHWMVDLVDVSPFRLSGGILISPNQRFPFQNGTLTVEADAAQGTDGMGGADHYYELDVSPADAPTPWTVDSLYGYGQFGGRGAMGCRLENPAIVCAMYDNSNRVTGGECPNDGRVCTNNGGRPGRVWETQGIGTSRTASSIQGGYREWVIPNSGGLRVQDVMRSCGPNIHDLHCRDRFRMELTRTSVHLYSNGYPILLIDGLYAVNPATGADNRIPQEWLNNGARFYMTSWINSGQHTPLRWHWNNVAVNPPYPASASHSDSWCLGTNWQNANGTISPNTCPHAHVQSCPELQAPNTTCAGATSTPVPATSTPIPSTATPIPATSTPTAQSTNTPDPTATATSTPVPATCEALVRLNGVEQWIPKPVEFCQAN